MTVGIREYLIVELIVSNCLGMTNLGSAVNTHFWMFDCQRYLVATGHMQLFLRELEKKHNTSLPCLNLAYGYSTADTSTFLRFQIFGYCCHLLALVGLSTLIVCWWPRNTAVNAFSLFCGSLISQTFSLTHALTVKATRHVWASHTDVVFYCTFWIPCTWQALCSMHLSCDEICSRSQASVTFKRFFELCEIIESACYCNLFKIVYKFQL